MTGRIAGVLVGLGLCVSALAAAGGARAAGDVVVSASPSEARIGEPVEVLVRTFLVVGRGELALPFETPLEPYPVPSGGWHILYSWPDYPFDVVAEHSDGTGIAVAVARDPSDSTLWRGFVSLPKAGAWTVWVRNFPGKEAGSTTVISAVAASPGSVGPGPAALLGALVGFLGGFVVPLALRRGSRAG